MWDIMAITVRGSTYPWRTSCRLLSKFSEVVSTSIKLFCISTSGGRIQIRHLCGQWDGGRQNSSVVLILRILNDNRWISQKNLPFVGQESGYDCVWTSQHFRKSLQQFDKSFTSLIHKTFLNRTKTWFTILIAYTSGYKQGPCTPRGLQKDFAVSMAFICTRWKQNSKVPNYVPWWSSLQKTNWTQP